MVMSSPESAARLITEQNSDILFQNWTSSLFMFNKGMESVPITSRDARKDCRSGYGRMESWSLKKVGVRPL